MHGVGNQEIRRVTLTLSFNAEAVAVCTRDRASPIALTLNCRHEVALKCPGGTKATSLRFQPEVSVAHEHDASRRDASDASARVWV